MIQQICTIQQTDDKAGYYWQSEDNACIRGGVVATRSIALRQAYRLGYTHSYRNGVLTAIHRIVSVSGNEYALDLKISLTDLHHAAVSGKIK